jgi:hypothetical protein
MQKGIGWVLIAFMTSSGKNNTSKLNASQVDNATHSQTGGRRRGIGGHRVAGPARAHSKRSGRRFPTSP